MVSIPYYLKFYLNPHINLPLRTGAFTVHTRIDHLTAYQAESVSWSRLFTRHHREIIARATAGLASSSSSTLSQVTVIMSSSSSSSCSLFKRQEAGFWNSSHSGNAILKSRVQKQYMSPRRVHSETHTPILSLSLSRSLGASSVSLHASSRPHRRVLLMFTPRVPVASSMPFPYSSQLTGRGLLERFFFGRDGREKRLLVDSEFEWYFQDGCRLHLWLFICWILTRMMCWFDERYERE